MFDADTQQLIVLIIGAAWAFIKTTEWYKGLVKKKFELALESIAAAVNNVWLEYVKDIKLASADGKLTDDEKATARLRARTLATALAKDR